MNYRHVFHAGNFADVFKHSALALVLRYLNQKPAAWRFIDTHAGIGLYDLASDEAERTAEWRSGIGRIAAHLGFQTSDSETASSSFAPSREALALLEPFRSALTSVNPDRVLRYYPGSSTVARSLARQQDRLLLTELHPQDSETLRQTFAGDQQVKVRTLDGWLALGAFVPPPERRGLVLIDPPFEENADFERLASGLTNAHDRWPTGCYMMWHPVKDIKTAQRYEAALKETQIVKVLLAELSIRRRTNETLDGCGMVFVNPPYNLEAELRVLLPYLAAALSQGSGSSHRVVWLRGEA